MSSFNGRTPAISGARASDRALRRVTVLVVLEQEIQEAAELAKVPD